MGGGNTLLRWQRVELSFRRLCDDWHINGELWYSEQVLTVEERVIGVYSASSVVAKTD
jgi:hypothetical protein